MIPKEISRDHIFKALEEIDATGVPSERESTQWLLRQDGKVYPPKYVISVAGKYALGQKYSHESFSGGPSTNNFLKSRGFEIVPMNEGRDGGRPKITAYSWTIEDANNATKVLDKSAFLHRGTGIPKEIRFFLLEDELAGGEKRPITLLHDGKSYSAHIDLEAQGTARLRLFWNSDFASLLRNTFPYHYQQYKAGKEPESQVILRLERDDNFASYQVSFAGEVPEDQILEDIQAEELEDKGLGKEGAVREYFGKRYERDPRNRALAIRYHGVTCMACGFNFEAVYGERGCDYIEVHHNKPIHTFEGKEQHVNPKTDLATLCSNCHRMIHRRADNVLNIEQLRVMICRMRGGDE